MAARKTASTDTQSWDAFWAEVNRSGDTEVIRGVRVRVPTDLPLIWQQRANALKDSTADEDVRELVGLLFGDDVLDQWVSNGMGAREFQIVCAWGYANAAGQPTSFREAYDLVTAAEAEGKAPGPNRATRRAATSKRSAATGGASKRTSPASTASARRTSRA